MSEIEFEAVLFDVDGTLSDSSDGIARGLAETHAHFDGVTPDLAILLARMGMGLRDQLSFYCTTPLSQAEMQPRVDFALERFRFYAAANREFDEAVAALRTFRSAGLKIALVTSKERSESQQFLQHFSASDAIDCVVCASDVTHPKPHPESVISACRLLGVQPNVALLIGDSIFDLKCAHAAGAAAAAVLYGAGTRQDLLAERPELVFENPLDLLDWSRTAVHRPTCLEKR